MRQWIVSFGCAVFFVNLMGCAAEPQDRADNLDRPMAILPQDLEQGAATLLAYDAGASDENFRAFDTVPQWASEDTGLDKGVGTIEARGRDWQFFAALRGRVGDAVQYDCGGSAVSEDWVLTAAHCVEGAAPDAGSGVWTRPGKGAIEIVLGQPDLAAVKAEHVYRAIDVRVPGNYGREGPRNTPINDVALIRLDRPWEGPVIRLSGSRASDVDRFFGQVFFAGHGNTERETSILQSFDVDGVPHQAFAPRLQAGLIPARSPESCVTDYDLDAFDPDVMLCAGFASGAVDACQGDSGGPLIARDLQGRVYQVGIISSGFSCGAENSPGLYTRVSAFTSFIAGATGASPFVEAVPEFSVTMTKSGLNALRGRVGGAAAAENLTLELSRSTFPKNAGQSYDRMTVTARTRVAGRLWVFDIDSETGKATCIFPCADSEISKSIVSAGEELRLPSDRTMNYPLAPTKPGPGEIVAFVLPPRVALVSEAMPDLGLTKGPPETVRLEYPDLLIAEFDTAPASSTAQLPAGVAAAAYVVE